MRAKKLSKIFSFFFIIALSFSISASAHSGRTDGNGGHYNRSTGEYHYHHGYPAHSHYDIDGDGTIDCPYNFDDQTNRDSGKTSSSITSTKPASENGLDSMGWSIIGVLIVCVITFEVFVIANSITKKKREREWNKSQEKRMQIADEQRRERKALIQRLAIVVKYIQEAERQRLFEEKKSKFAELYGGRSIYEIIDAPSDSEIGEDGLPKNIGANGWGSKYTFYTSSNGKRYHTGDCRYANQLYKVNACSLVHSDSLPCSFCKPILPDVSWVREYRRIVQIKKYYDINIQI